MKKLAAVLRHHRMEYAAHAFRSDGKLFRVHYFICCLASTKEQKIFRTQVDENLQFIQGLIQQNQLLQSEDSNQPLYMRERKGQVNEHARQHQKLVTWNRFKYKKDEFLEDVAEAERSGG